MPRDIREVLKSILTTDMTGGTKGGLMLPDQADRFLDLTLEYSTLLDMVRVEKKRRKQGELDTLNVGSVVTEGTTEAPGDGTSPAEEVKPTFGKLEYTMKKFRSMFDITTETLIDNVESEMALFTQHAGLRGDEPETDFRETLMRAYAKRIATDYELCAIQGDESIVDVSTKLNRLLKNNDGWDVLTNTGTHLVDAGYLNVSEHLFSAMLEAMPSPYMKRLNELRWFIGPKANIRYERRLTQRATDLGDKILEGGKHTPFGIEKKMIPLIPEDKTATVGTTSYTGLSFLWLTFPDNLIYCPRREVETYWEFVPRRDKWENTTYGEMDCLVENPDCVVKAINVKVDSSTYYGV